jgi:hypothetical protein
MYDTNTTRSLHYENDKTYELPIQLYALGPLIQNTKKGFFETHVFKGRKRFELNV